MRISQADIESNKPVAMVTRRTAVVTAAVNKDEERLRELEKLVQLSLARGGEVKVRRNSR